MSAVAVFLGGFICLGWDLFVPYREISILIAMISVVFFVGAGNALNDYEDRFIDKTAHPDRPIPSKKIKPGSARTSAIIMFIVAVFASLLINIHLPIPSVLLLINLAIMLSYELKYKNEGLVGNLSISWLTASLFLFGAVAMDRINILVVFFTIMAFLAIFMREIVKDIEDVKGDKGIRRTAPIVYGIGPSSFLATQSLVSAIFLSIIPYIIHIISVYYLILVLVADAIFIYSLILLYLRKARNSQNYAKLGMLFSLIAFAIGVIV